jgi:hypothetical protein
MGRHIDALSAEALIRPLIFVVALRGRHYHGFAEASCNSGIFDSGFGSHDGYSVAAHAFSERRLRIYF